MNEPALWARDVITAKDEEIAELKRQVANLRNEVALLLMTIERCRAV